MNHEIYHARALHVHDRMRGLVADLLPDEVPLPEATSLWDTFDDIERCVAAAKVLLARKVDEAADWKHNGYRSAADYMANRAGSSMTIAHAALSTSKRLSDCPDTEAALRAGELSLAQAETISIAAKAAAAAKPDKNLHNTERDLLMMAPTASLTELRQESGRIRVAADDKPKDTYDRNRAQRGSRTWVDNEGVWHMSLRGTPEDGGAFQSTILPLLIEAYTRSAGSGEPVNRAQLVYDCVFEALRRGRCYADGIDITTDDHAYWNTAATGDEASDSRQGAAPKSTPDSTGNTEQQPDNDTVEPQGGACSESAGANDEDEVDPSSAPEQPRWLRTPKRVNPAYLAALHLSITALQRGEVGGNERCEVADIGAIPVEVARGLLDEAVVKLVVTDPDGNVTRVVSLGAGSRAAELIDPGHHQRQRRRRTTPVYLALVQVDEAHVNELLIEPARQRLERKGQNVAELKLQARHPNAAQRFALAWMQPQCMVEGCCRTACQYDHRDAYAHTHWTWLHDLDRLCSFHHSKKTHEGWALVEGTGKRPMVPSNDPRHPSHKPKADAA